MENKSWLFFLMRACLLIDNRKTLQLFILYSLGFLFWQNVQESSHNTYFSLVHSSARSDLCCSSFLFSSLNSVGNSIISAADDFDFRFLFFFGTAFAKGNSSSSSVDWEPVLAVGNEETVARGIIFESLWKNSAIARLQTRTPSCHSLFWHCALLLFFVLL